MHDVNKQYFVQESRENDVCVYTLFSTYTFNSFSIQYRNKGFANSFEQINNIFYNVATIYLNYDRVKLLCVNCCACIVLILDIWFLYDDPSNNGC